MTGRISAQLRLIARAQRSLAQRLPTSSDVGCEELKNNQFAGLLTGTYREIAAQPNRENDILSIAAFNPYASLSMLQPKHIQCDFEFPKDDRIYTALDLHQTEGKSWCADCLRKERGGIDFSKGIFNGFRCWRRGGTSGLFGFVHRSSISLKNQVPVHRAKDFLCTPQLQTRIRVEQNQKHKIVSMPVRRKNAGRWARNCNLVLIDVSLEEHAYNDASIEIENILTQQLLASGQILPSRPTRVIASEDSTTLVPRFILSVLSDIHETWLKDGSQGSLGVVGLLVLDNGSSLFQSTTFMTALRTFCDKRSIVFGGVELSKANTGMLQELGLDDEGRPLQMAVFLDTILGLGGVEDGG